MKVTFEWLKEFVDIDISVYELAERLTLTGPEVSSIKPIGISKENQNYILLSKVLEIDNVKPSSNLRICKLLASNKNYYDIITNSTHIEKGDYVIIGIPDAELPSGIKIKEKEFMGFKSQGMILAKEHLNLEEKSSDIWILGKDEKNAKLLFDLYTMEDYILEIEVTSNRSDCLSVIGIAREISAMLNKELKLKKIDVKENIDILPDIQIEVKNLCPRYTSRIMQNVKVKDSPEFIKKRLELCGIRAINNIVDATNYVLLEYGHPLHAFDLNRLDGKKIIVRNPEKGEKITTLDGNEHELKEDMILIADEKKGVALAGIMGGENSEIVEDTNEILLEAAYFDPLTIRRTSKTLGIRTESSYRFERTANWSITPIAIDRTVEIIQMTCPDAKISKMNDVFFNYFKDKILTIKSEFVSKKLGFDINIKEIENILKRLQFNILTKREDSLEIKIPPFRPDINKSIDIVEEVARIYGYNNIPQNPFKPPIDIESLKKPIDFNFKLIDILINVGFTQVYNYNFLSTDDIEKFKLLKEKIIYLQNPLSLDAALLRTNIYPNLIKNICHNTNYSQLKTLKLFEIGKIFYKLENELIEKEMVGLTIYGKNYDYYYLSGIVEYLINKFGKAQVIYKKTDKNFLHPVNSAEILINNQIAGFVGEIHPDILEFFEIDFPVFIAEIDTAILKQLYIEPYNISPISKFPMVVRDLSFVIEKSIMGRELMIEVSNFSPLIQKVDFVDLYEDEKLGLNKKSITLSITFQSHEKTLNSQEVDQIINDIIKSMENKFNAKLRS